MESGFCGPRLHESRQAHCPRRVNSVLGKECVGGTSIEGERGQCDRPKALPETPAALWSISVVGAIFVSIYCSTGGARQQAAPKKAPFRADISRRTCVFQQIWTPEVAFMQIYRQQGTQRKAGASVENIKDVLTTLQRRSSLRIN